MGERRKEGMLRPGDKPPEKEDNVDFTILDVSDYDPPRVPSKTWRELIKNVWEIDPLTCPRCGSEMKIISLIQDPDVIRQILKHLGFWKQDARSRCKKPKPDHGPVVYGEFDGGWPPIRRIEISPPLIPVQLIFIGSYWPCVRKIYVN
jgi:hypothetical protein